MMNGIRTPGRPIGIGILLLAICISIQLRFAHLARASDDFEVMTVLEESEAIRLALEQSRKLEFMETDVRISENRLESAGAIENPELRLRSRIGTTDSRDDEDFRVGLRWDPPQYGSLREEEIDAEVDVYEKLTDAVRYRDRLINKMRKIYAEVIYGDELADLARQKLGLETRRLAIVQKMVELGERSVVYLTKSRMWLAESRQEFEQSLHRGKAARRNLSQMTGKPENVGVVCETIPLIDADTEILMQIALQNRPEIKLAASRTKLAIQRSRVEKLKLIPRPTFLDFGYNRDPADDDRVEIQVGLELPVFNWNRGNILATGLAVKRKESASAAVQEQIWEELNEVYEVYSDCLTDWRNFNQELAGMVEDTRRVIDRADEHRVLAPDEVLELDLVMVGMRQILAEKRERLAEAFSDLLFVMGVEAYGDIAAVDK